MTENCRSDPALFTEDTELKRDLGLLEAVSIVIGRIIGSGIFRTPAPIMALVLSTSLFGLAWVVGGIVTILCAVCYAELVAMMPKSGGPYVYLKAAYHPVVPFLRGWAMFFVSETAAIAAVALVFAEYFGAMYSIIFGETLGSVVLVSISLGTIWSLTAINLFGVHLSGIVQNIFSSVKIVAVLAIVVSCFSSHGSTANFASPFWPESFSWATVMAFGAAMRYSLFAFSGWEGATYVAEEVKNPRKNLPLSLMLGIGGVILLYLGANAAYLYQLPVPVIAQSRWVATDAVSHAIGSMGGIMISVAVMMNTFGNVSTQVLCKARTWQAMAGDGLFFKFLSPLSERFKTPNNALIGQAVWASVLLLFAAFAKNSYEVIIDFFSANGTIFNILTLYSLYILRKKYPHIERPFRAWMYPYSLILVIAIYFAFLVVTLVTAFIPSLLGLLLTSSGLIYYFLKVKNRCPEGQA